MKEIEISSMNINDPEEVKGNFLEGFEARYDIKAKSLHIDWGDAWNQLVRFGLNAHGPDVSEIGTTWLGGLHTMDALSPFTPAEATFLGGAEAFQPVSWHACHVDQSNLTMGIPLVVDMRVILYRQDWLQKAGVDEATAFVDFEHFSNTLRSLQAVGYTSPFTLPTSRSMTRLIHDMACWVWSAGGEIRSGDGRRMLLMEPQSRAGMQAYFELNQFISPEMQSLAEHEVFDAFFTGKCGVAITSERRCLEVALRSPRVTAEVAENFGVAMLMKNPFVGGTALSIWRYSQNRENALKLIQYLISPEAWQFFNKQALPHIPARLNLLAESPIAKTFFYPTIQKTLENGRSFQSGYRWSGVESRLVWTIQSIWDDLRADPSLNIASEIEKRFSAVCTRLEQTILVS